MHSHIFIYLNFNIYFSVLTMYAFVYRHKWHALLLMMTDRHAGLELESAAGTTDDDGE